MTHHRGKTTDEGAPSLFTTEDRGDVRILRFLPHQQPGVAADYERVRPLWGFLRDQQEHPPKVLVIDMPPGLVDPESVDAFWNRGLGIVALEEAAPDRSVAGLMEAQRDLVREENAFHIFVQRMQAIDALVICAIAGRVDLPFLGLGLACDYRIIAEDTLFLNRSLEAGLPPCGGAPWFLLRSLGTTQGTAILLTKKEIPAQLAHELGLVDRVVPADELEKEAMEFAEELASKSAARLHAMKQAIRATNLRLDDYFDEEARILTRCLHHCVAEEHDPRRHRGYSPL